MKLVMEKSNSKKFIDYNQEGITFQVEESNKFLLKLLEKGFNLIAYAESFNKDIDKMALNHPANFIKEEEMEDYGEEISKINKMVPDLQEKIPTLRKHELGNSWSEMLERIQEGDNNND